MQSDIGKINNKETQSPLSLESMKPTAVHVWEHIFQNFKQNDRKHFNAKTIKDHRKVLEILPEHISSYSMLIGCTQEGRSPVVITPSSK